MATAQEHFLKTIHRPFASKARSLEDRLKVGNGVKLGSDEGLHPKDETGKVGLFVAHLSATSFPHQLSATSFPHQRLHLLLHELAVFHGEFLSESGPGDQLRVFHRVWLVRFIL